MKQQKTSEQILYVLLVLLTAISIAFIVINLPIVTERTSIKKEKTQVTVDTLETVQRGSNKIYYVITTEKAYVEIPQEAYNELRTGSKMDVYKIKTYNMGDTDRIYYEYVGD